MEDLRSFADKENGIARNGEIIEGTFPAFGVVSGDSKVVLIHIIPNKIIPKWFNVRPISQTWSLRCVNGGFVGGRENFNPATIGNVLVTNDNSNVISFRLGASSQVTYDGTHVITNNTPVCGSVIVKLRVEYK